MTAIKSPSRKGDLAEQFVILLANWKGAEVFNNVNCSGETDLILEVNGQFYRIDVKMAQLKPKRTDKHGQTRKPSWGCCKATGVPSHIYPVVVIPSGDILDWKVQWHHNRVPVGLEDFWSKHYCTYTTTK